MTKKPDEPINNEPDDDDAEPLTVREAVEKAITGNLVPASRQARPSKSLA